LFHSYLGNQGRFNQIETEFGIIYIDQLQYNVVQFTENPQIISEPIKMFLQNNLKSFLNEDYYNATLNNFPYLDNHTFKYGLGLYTAYDYDTKRLIIHKKDYKPLFPVLAYDVAAPEPQMSWYNDAWYYCTDIGCTQIYYTNKDYFEDKSFTLSYDLRNKVWLSFHSYQPNYMFSGNRSFYTLNDNKGIYKHDNDLNQSILW